MSKGPETKFKEMLTPYLNELLDSWFFKTQEKAMRGIPDVIGCVRGKFVALELKKDDKAKATKLQRYVLDKIREAGGYAEVCHPYNYERILRELRRLQ